MGLDEHAIDLFEIDEAGLVTHRFDERTEAEVSGATQESLAGANDQGQGFGAEGVVAEAGAVELVEDERFDGLGSQA